MRLKQPLKTVQPASISQWQSIRLQIIIIITQVLLATQLSWIDITIGYN